MKAKKRGPGRPREIIGEKAVPRRVMALRAKGLSFGQIAKRIGFSKARAQQIHSRVLAEQNGG